MKLIDVHGGTKESLLNNEYNIGIGISLGNKYFSPEKILESIKWALPYTKNHLIVYVADSIHKINIEVRKGKSSESALKQALTQGDQIIEKVKKLVEVQLFTNKIPIIYAHWKDLEDNVYIEKKKYLYDLYNEKSKFYNTLLNIVRKITDKEDRPFSNEQLEKMGTYIIEELPEVLDRVLIAGNECDAYIYPERGPLSDLVLDIQNGKVFPEIKERIIKNQKVFLEVR